MEINLSNEMIEKITCVAFGRIHDLSEKEKEVKEWMAVGKGSITRKHNMLKDIQRAKEEATEVHGLFLELMEQIGKKNTELKMYRAEIEDDNFEIILAENDDEALKKYWEMEEEHNVYGLYRLDKDYNVIGTL